MLTIYFKDGSVTTYKECEYTDYEYLRSVFVVVKVTKWIGIYNMDEIKCIEVKN